jgi:heme/copper-type cytochrome/quinol oxidase subunit 2
MKSKKPSLTFERAVAYAVVILGCILVVLFVSLYLQYRALRQEQILNFHAWRSVLLERHAPLKPALASDVRVWMTFDYINKLFGLPPDYLRQQLQITNLHYPRLSLSSYAKTEATSTLSVLTEVETAIRNYVPSPSSSTTTAIIKP